MGHFAHDCSEPKKVTPIPTSLHMVCVSSTILITESYPLWIVDSGATHHVAKDQGAFVEYHRIPTGSKWIYVRNNSAVEVKGIGTCKLDLLGGRTLFLHDVLFAPKIKRNLIFVVSLVGLGYCLHFKKYWIFLLRMVLFIMVVDILFIVFLY